MIRLIAAIAALVVVIISIISLVRLRSDGRAWSDRAVVLWLVAVLLSSVFLLSSLISSFLPFLSSLSSPSSSSSSSLPSSSSPYAYLRQLPDDRASDLQGELVSDWEALQQRKHRTHRTQRSMSHARIIYQQEQELLDQLDQLYQHPLFRDIHELAHDLKAYHLIHNQHFASLPSEQQRFIVAYRSPIDTSSS